MTATKCRWGILGTATIAQKNWQSILNSGNAELTAVASRDPSRAAAFIQARQAECPFPSVPTACHYEELIARIDVDAVYIPLPTGTRSAWSIKAAEAGKHVLSEKPSAVSAAELRKVLDACRANGVQFMDGVMFMHSQRLAALRASLESPSPIGQIRRMSSHFSFRANDDFLQGNIRTSSQLEPHGCLGDLGWYCIRMALWTMNYQMPTDVTARLLAQHGGASSPEAVPLELTGEVRFPGDVSFGFYCSFLIEQQQTFTISGTHGYLTLDDFVLPYFGNEAAFSVINNDFQIQGCRFNMAHHQQRVAVSEFSNNHPTSQETNMFRTFSSLVLNGQRDENWGDIALKTQIVTDACLESAHNGGRTIALS